MKERILDAAEKLVQDRGLSAVSFQDLANEVGLRKASIFHHFQNKEAIALALIDRCGSKHGPQYEAVVQSEATAPQKLQQIAAIFETGLKKKRPCLIAALGGGLNTLPDKAAKELGKTANAAITRFALIFEQGSSEGTLDYQGTAADAAMAFFAMLQGLQVLARTSGNVRTFKTAAATYIDSITTA